MEKDIIDYLRHGLPEGYYDPETVNLIKGKARLDDYVEGEKLGVIRLEEDKEEETKLSKEDKALIDNFANENVMSKSNLRQWKSF